MAPFRVYWLGASFRGLGVQQVSHDPGGAYSVQYGNCLTGGQGTCLPPLLVVTSPENTFVPGGSARTRQVQIRGLPALEAHSGQVVMIPTGDVVVDIFAPTARGWPARRPATWPRSTLPGAPGASAARVPPDQRLQRAPVQLPGSEPAAPAARERLLPRSGLESKRPRRGRARPAPGAPRPSSA